MHDLTENPLKIISKQMYTEKSTNYLKTYDILNIQHLYRARQKVHQNYLKIIMKYKKL